MSNILHIILASFLLFLNAFFVAAEFGMIKLRSTQVSLMEKTHGIRGHILAKIHKHLDTYLSACQLGITLASLGLGWVGEPAVAYVLEPIFAMLGMTSLQLIKVFSFIVAFTLLSLLHIVVGELMPKSLAIRQPEPVSLWTAIPLYGFFIVMQPVISLLNSSANFMLKITKLDTNPPKESFYSAAEIKLILTSSHLHGELSHEETKIIENTMDFADLTVNEVMRSRDEMKSLDINSPVAELIETILKYRYSRYPVYDVHQNIIGLIHVKDLFATLYKKNAITDVISCIRPVLKISEDFPAINLLRKFRTGMPHFALVYRDGSTLIGFVTLDNLLQVLIGRIKDEFHKTKLDWKENPDGTFTVNGDCSIYFLERALDQNIEVNIEQKVNTITGLIFHRLGAFPQEGELIKFNGFDVIVEKRKGPKIEKVKVIPKKTDVT